MRSTPPPPVTTKGHATRDRLLRTARDLIIEGDGHVELAAVGRRARTRPSLVHRYFGSKGALVGAIVADFYGRLAAEVLDLRLDPDGTWASRERHRVELGVAFHYADPLAPVVYGRLARDPLVATMEVESIAAVVRAGTRNIERGIEAGELPPSLDPGLAAAAIFGSMRQILAEALGRPTPPDRSVVAEVHWRQVAAAVRIDPDSASVVSLIPYQLPEGLGVADG